MARQFSIRRVGITVAGAALGYLLGCLVVMVPDGMYQKSHRRELAAVHFAWVMIAAGIAAIIANRPNSNRKYPCVRTRQ